MSTSSNFVAKTILQTCPHWSNSLSIGLHMSYTTTKLLASFLFHHNHSRPPSFFSSSFSPIPLVPQIATTIPASKLQTSQLTNKTKKTYSVKSRHRFIRTANLHKPRRSHHTITLTIRALFGISIGICPGIFASEYIFLFFAHKGFAVEDGAGEDVLVGTGETFETICAGEILCRGGRGGRGMGGYGDGEDVAAGRTD